MFVFPTIILIVYISHNMAILSNFMRSGNCKHSSLHGSAAALAEPALSLNAVLYKHLNWWKGKHGSRNSH